MEISELQKLNIYQKKSWKCLSLKSQKFASKISNFEATLTNILEKKTWKCPSSNSQTFSETKQKFWYMKFSRKLGNFWNWKFANKNSEILSLISQIFKKKTTKKNVNLWLLEQRWRLFWCLMMHIPAVDEILTSTVIVYMIFHYLSHEETYSCVIFIPFLI